MESYKNQLLSIYPLPNIKSSKKKSVQFKNNNIVHFKKTNTPMNLLKRNFIDRTTNSPILKIEEINNEKLNEFMDRIIKSKTLVIGASYNDNEQTRIEHIDKYYIGVDVQSSAIVPVDFKNKDQFNSFLDGIMRLRKNKPFDNIIIDGCVINMLFYDKHIEEWHKKELDKKMKEFKEQDEGGRQIQVIGSSMDNEDMRVVDVPYSFEEIYDSSNFDLMLKYLKPNGNFIFCDIHQRENNIFNKFILKFRPDVKVIFMNVNYTNLK